MFVDINMFGNRYQEVVIIQWLCCAVFPQRAFIYLIIITTKLIFTYSLKIFKTCMHVSFVIEIMEPNLPPLTPLFICDALRHIGSQANLYSAHFILLCLLIALYILYNILIVTYHMFHNVKSLTFILICVLIKIWNI